MDTAVALALIASATSLTVTGVSVATNQWGTREAREHARRSEAKVVLDRYRGPLLAAAWELGDRVDNIRHRGFLGYASGDGKRALHAELTTLFRFAQYFGWREVLRTEVQLLKFEDERDTELVASLIGDIVSVFATDSLDQGRAMVWSEEQRAIGELMIGDRAEPGKCIGYAAFFDEYDDRFRLWMEDFLAALRAPAASQCDRLRLLQWALAGLVLQLDEEKTRGSRGWTERSWDEFRDRNAPSTTTNVERRLRERLTLLEQRS